MRHSRLLALAVPILLLAANSRTAQQPSPTQQPTSTQTEQVPAENLLSKAVVMITTQIEGDSRAFGGTGFIVQLEDNRLPVGQKWGYLVTNRHVAQAIFTDASGQCKATTSGPLPST